jgi:hypothetical protein
VERTTLRPSGLTAVRSGRLLAALCASASLIACSSSHAHPATSPGPTAPPATAGGHTIDQKTFDVGSNNYFPRTTLAMRTQLAQQLCDSIKQHGDNLLTWLTQAVTDPQLFPHGLSSVQLGSFTGIAISYKCPKAQYFAELQQGLAGIPAGVNLGKSSPTP